MKSRWIIAVGVLLAVAGTTGLAMGSIPYEDEEVILDAGTLEASASVEKEWTVPPLAAGATLALGGVLMTLGALRRT